MCIILLTTEANKVAEVAKIQYDQKVMEKEKQKEMSRIDDEAYLARLKSQADALFYSAQKEADSNAVSRWTSIEDNIIIISLFSLSSLLNIYN